MEKSKIKLISGLVLQFPANFEVDVIRDENGIMFVPMLQMSGMADIPAPTSPPATPTKKASEPAASPKEASPAKYSESDLEEMELSELNKIAIKMGIELSDFEGKNTNKKIRTLILQSQNGEKLTWPEGAAPVEKPASKEKPAAPAPVKASAKGIPPSKFEGDEISIEEVETGDELDVYWGGDLNEWYKGVCVKASGDTKTIKYYADNAKEILDPAVHIKIIRLKDV